MNSYLSSIDDIRRIVNGIQPKKNISKMLYMQKCFYLLSKIKGKDCYTKLLKTQYNINKIYLSERYRICKCLFQKFEDMNILYAVIKGAVLSQAAYKNQYIRQSKDIDILINRKDIDKVKYILNKFDFKQGHIKDGNFIFFTREEIIFQAALSHQIAPFVKINLNPNVLTANVCVDINTDILWGESSIKIDMYDILAKTERTEINGVIFNKLNTIFEFIVLCLHHYKDMNSIYLLAKGSLNLSLISDIYFYLKNNDINYEELKRIADGLKVAEYIYYCLFYSKYVFDDPFLYEYIESFESNEGKRLLNYYGLNKREKKKWKLSFEERLFREDFHEYFLKELDAEDLEKIRLNRIYL